MILSGTLMWNSDDRAVILRPGWVVVEGERIAAVHEGRCPHTPDLGGDGAIITPGFVDAHLHLPQFPVIGADGLELLDWLERIVFPEEAKWADADYAAEAAGDAVDQLLAHGTTAFAGYATVHQAGARAAMRAVRQRGVRAAIGQVLMDQQAPDQLIRPADQLLAEAAELLAEGERGRVQPSLNPRFAVACSEPLLRGCGELAARFNPIVQTHLAETTAECASVRRLHEGRDYVDVYHRAGLLTPRALLAHGVHLDDAERATLAAAGASVVHCPTANAFLAAGRMDRQACAAAGVGVALGSDVAGGPDRSMVRVARAMLDTARSLGNTPPSAAEAWRQITTTNADLLGWHRTGRLARGCEADLLVIQPDVAWQQAPDPLGMLLYAWDDRWLGQVVVAGRV